MKVFITQKIENEAIDLLNSNGVEVVCSGVDRPLTREEFLDGIKDVDAVILVWHTEMMDKEAFDHAPNIKIVARRGVGYDNIDVAEATRRGIAVTVTPVHTNTIADLTFGLIINAARRIPQADSYVRNGHWTEGGTHVAKLFMGFDIHEKTIGIIGFGRIGKNVAKRATGFNMRILYYDINRQPEAEEELGAEYASLEAIFQQADFISINCSLSEQTHHLINRDSIAKMKNNAVIVCTARGGIVDETALYEALKEGRLGGAGLDVFEPEPILPDNPLLKLDNVVFTPHLGTSVYESRVKMVVTAAEDVLRTLAGEKPIFTIN